MLEVLFFLTIGLRWVVATILVYYGITKLFTSKIPFELAISSYRLLPQWSVRPIANILPLVEIILGSTLLLNRASTAATLGTLLLLLLFLGAMGSALLRGLQIDCGCAGKKSMSLKSGFLRNLGLFWGLLISAGLRLQFMNTQIPPIHLPAIELVLLSLTMLLGILSAFNSNATRVVIAHSTRRSVQNRRRQFLHTTGMVAASLLALWFLDRQDVALADPPPCDCNCLGDIVETYDCNTYCPPGCGCPCSAPIFAIYYEVCCTRTNTLCDKSVAIVGYHPCC